MRAFLVLIAILLFPSFATAEPKGVLIDELLQKADDAEFMSRSDDKAECECLYDAKNGDGVPTTFVITNGDYYEISQPCAPACNTECKFYFLSESKRYGSERKGYCRWKLEL